MPSKIENSRHCLEYLGAALRKIRIAHFHYPLLQAALERYKEEDEDGLPHISIQAHFEGIVLCVASAIDKTCEAAAFIWEQPYKRNSILGMINQNFPEVKLGEMIRFQKDLQEVRNRMVHRNSEKIRDSSGWYIEDNLGVYSGNRDLISYAKTALDYGDKLNIPIRSLQGHQSPPSRNITEA